MAGGTLLQLIVPIMLIYGFLRCEYRPGVQFSLFCWIVCIFVAMAIVVFIAMIVTPKTMP